MQSVGGSGKSQAAAEWLRCRVAGGAEVVAWVLAESADTIVESLAAVAAGVGIDRDGMSVTAQALAARRWMENTGQAIAVVYDNVVDVALVRRWLPTVGRANVVVTGVRRGVRDLGSVIEVGPFTRPAARVGAIRAADASRRHHRVAR